jgi:5-methylcytosine-specific restriction protein A
MSAFLEGFNPAIDRYDRRRVAVLFQTLWPDPTVSRACAANLAASIRMAHEAGEACWGMTMHEHSLRLNVGQVETVTLAAQGAWFLFRAPLDLGMDRRFEIDISSDPRYPAVPIESGVCFVPAANMVSFPAIIRDVHVSYIRAAASYKRVSPFKKSYSPAVLEYLDALLGEALPRPNYVPKEVASQRVHPLADELDTSIPIREGARYQVMVNAYERDPRARQLCIEKYGTDCFICGFSFGVNYGEVADGFIHVHHLRPLSEIGEEYEVVPVTDLRPVCPNCHAVLHRRVPAYSIEEVRDFLRRSFPVVPK